MADTNTAGAGATGGDPGSSAAPASQAGQSAAPGQAPQSATPPAPAERTFTQAELDDHIKRRLAEEKARDQKRAEEERAKAQGEWQKLAEQREAELATLRAEAAQAKLEALRTRVAVKHQLPDLLAGRLTGTTEQELDADAAALAKLLPPRPVPTSSVANPPGSPPGAPNTPPGAPAKWGSWAGVFKT